MKLFLLLIISLLGFLSWSQLNDAIRFKIIDPTSNTDEAILRLHNNASIYFDPSWDAWKLFTPNDNYPSLYSKTNEGFDMSINANSFFQKDTSIFLWMRARVNGGTYSMETENLGALSPNLKIAIKDIVNGNIYSLDQNQIFNFDVTIDPNNDFQRFELFYSPRATFDVNDNTVDFHKPGCDSWEYEIYDQAWQSVTNGFSTSNTASVNISNNGTYMAIIRDTEFQLIDTLSFEIDVDNEMEVEHIELIVNNDLSLFNNESLSDIEVLFDNGKYLLNLPNLFEGEIKIFNLEGKLINAKQDDFQGVIELDVPNVTGLYIIQLVAGNEQRTLKIIR